jgi:hypothetical protein
LAGGGIEEQQPDLAGRERYGVAGGKATAARIRNVSYDMSEKRDEQVLGADCGTCRCRNSDVA